MDANQLSIKIGLTLRSSSDQFIKQGFHLNPKVYRGIDVVDFLAKFNTFEMAMIDSNYWVESLDNWKQMIDICWISERDYAKDRFDCDNFSQTFQSWASWYFDLNTAGRVYGEAYNLDGSKIGYHYWNAILTKDKNDELHLYMVEPQNKGIIEYNGEKEFVIQNMRYRPIKVYFG
jgi:hypothetical protein